MIGTLIGAGLGLASSIFGGISGSKARKKQREELERRLKDNEAWYNRKYYEDPTQRADTVRLLTQMQEQIRDRNMAAKGRQAVMGGTEDSTTATKEANNKTLADTTSKIVAENEARKDSIEKEYRNRKNELENGKSNLEAQSAGAMANTIQGVLGTVSNIATALDSGEKNQNKSNNDPLGLRKNAYKNATDAELEALDRKVGRA